jgi:hypothetical protein
MVTISVFTTGGFPGSLVSEMCVLSSALASSLGGLTSAADSRVVEGIASHSGSVVVLQAAGVAVSAMGVVSVVVSAAVVVAVVVVSVAVSAAVVVVSVAVVVVVVVVVVSVAVAVVVVAEGHGEIAASGGSEVLQAATAVEQEKPVPESVLKRIEAISSSRL